MDQVSQTRITINFDKDSFSKGGNVRGRVAEGVDIDGRDNNFDRTKFPIIMQHDNLEISSIYSSSFTTP